jgi:hypothetical protein
MSCAFLLPLRFLLLRTTVPAAVVLTLDLKTTLYQLFSTYAILICTLIHIAELWRPLPAFTMKLPQTAGHSLGGLLLGRAAITSSRTEDRKQPSKGLSGRDGAQSLLNASTSRAGWAQPSRGKIAPHLAIDHYRLLSLAKPPND